MAERVGRHPPRPAAVAAVPGGVHSTRTGGRAAVPRMRCPCVASVRGRATQAKCLAGCASTCAGAPCWVRGLGAVGRRDVDAGRGNLSIVTSWKVARTRVSATGEQRLPECWPIGSVFHAGCGYVTLLSAGLCRAGGDGGSLAVARGDHLRIRRRMTGGRVTICGRSKTTCASRLKVVNSCAGTAHLIPTR